MLPAVLMLLEWSASEAAVSVLATLESQVYVEIWSHTCDCLFSHSEQTCCSKTWSEDTQLQVK